MVVSFKRIFFLFRGGYFQCHLVIPTSFSDLIIIIAGTLISHTGTSISHIETSLPQAETSMSHAGFLIPHAEIPVSQFPCALPCCRRTQRWQPLHLPVTHKIEFRQKMSLATNFTKKLKKLTEQMHYSCPRGVKTKNVKRTNAHLKIPNYPRRKKKDSKGKQTPTARRPRQQI